MKKYFLYIAAVLLAFTAAAKPVPVTTAQRVAEGLLQKTVVLAEEATFTECYLFRGADGDGFALIAADDCVRPVLGYSLSDTFPLEEMPAHIAAWIDGYQADIAALRQAGVQGGEDVLGEWSSLIDLKVHFPRTPAVAPLMTTTWNQSPYYNDLCPYELNADSVRRYCVTGCVATAQAQVMKYWNHPAVGRGSHTYYSNYGTLSANFDSLQFDWTHMPNALNGASSDTQVTAVAQLMLAVGIAVEMGYGVHSSGAHVTQNDNNTPFSSEHSLKNFFRYNQGLFSAAKADYSDREWDSLLTADIRAGRPILVSGSDNDGGHAFVIDGFDSTGFFHLNWGWGGYCDGYYTLDSLNPDGSGIGGNATNGYNYDCKALLHVFPASEDSLVTVTVVPNNPLWGSVTGGGTFAPYTNTTIIATANEGYRFKGWKNGCTYNPHTFAPNHSLADTAIFQSIGGDTLSYCYGNYKSLWGEYAGVPPEWGIRIPARAIAPRRQLNHVQFYGASGAVYTVKVYCSNEPTNMIYTTNVSCPSFGWYTISLPQPVPLLDSLPLWVVLTSNTFSNPGIVSNYTGNPDGTWYKRAGTEWSHLEQRGEYLSWMIRAITGPMQPVEVGVSANDPERGTVSGGGLYYPGDTATLTATPNEGFRFAGWSSGETQNPLVFRVTSARNVTATFVRETSGISSVDDSNAQVIVSGRTITVLSDEPVGIYDLQGRLLSTTTPFLAPAPGVYMVQLKGYPAIKVIVG